MQIIPPLDRRDFSGGAGQFQISGKIQGGFLVVTASGLGTHVAFVIEHENVGARRRAKQNRL